MKTFDLVIGDVEWGQLLRSSLGGESIEDVIESIEDVIECLFDFACSHRYGKRMVCIYVRDPDLVNKTRLFVFHIFDEPPRFVERLDYSGEDMTEELLEKLNDDL
jgi:hypothetical protein